MKIIIPMAGSGKRFIDAGYRTAKPLILVDGRPMIEHVVDLFPRGEAEFVFICNSQHLETTDMAAVLKRIAPASAIVPIAPHKKGPVFSVAQAFDRIDDCEEVIVNYCDFSKNWDYQDFLAGARKRRADGSVTAYRGFHPHMLGTTNYAFIREEGGSMLEIREKQPFTDDRMSEFASDGTYYFRRGEFVKKYFRRLMDDRITIGGEYYVSMVYNLLIKDGLRVSVHEIEHMLQWGAPEDLEEYQQWSECFRRLSEPRSVPPAMRKGLTVIPLAGRGNRFIAAGYSDPKPLIPVDGMPMVMQAAACLPRTERTVFVCLRDHLARYPLENRIRSAYPSAKIVVLDEVTQGEACTVLAGLENEDLDLPLLVSASDNGILWDHEALDCLLRNTSADAVIWSFRNGAQSARTPGAYGWIRVNSDNDALSVSVKAPLSDTPRKDHAIVGTFYFRKARYFVKAAEHLRAGNSRVNGELYVDSCMEVLIREGRRVKVFEVDHYIGWGSPNELKTYEYWQRFFHKCPWHPYSRNKERNGYSRA